MKDLMHIFTAVCVAGAILSLLRYSDTMGLPDGLYIGGTRPLKLQEHGVLRIALLDIFQMY